MITASGIRLEDFTQSLFDTQILVEPPSSEILVAARPFILNRVEDQTTLQFENQAVHEFVSNAAEAVLEGILVSGKRDLERHPSSVRSHLNFGISLLNQGQLDDAAKQFNLALAKDPGSFVAGMALARVRVMQGDLEGGAQLYYALAKEHPREASPPTSLAYIAMRRGDFEEAEKLLRRVLFIKRNSVFTEYHLALVLLKMGRSDEAIRLLKSATAREVRWPAIHHALGAAYVVKGDLKKASRSFGAALALAPNMRETVHALSSVYLRMGESHKAVGLLRSYLEKQSEDFETREILAKAFLDTGHVRDARIELDKLWQSRRQENNSVELSRIVNNIGFCYALEHNTEAERYFKKAVSLTGGDSPIPYTNLARWYFSRHQLENASNILAIAKERFPQNQDIRLLNSATWQGHKEYDTDIESLMQIITTGEAIPGMYSVLGWILADGKRDFKSAEAILKTGYEKYPQDEAIVNNYAYVLLMTGEITRARTVLTSFPKHTNPSVFLTATWGLLYLCEGNLDQGKFNYQLAQQMASHEGKTDLARTVRQKMHLELARAYIRQGERKLALDEIEKGLQNRGGTPQYREDLELTRAQIALQN